MFLRGRGMGACHRTSVEELAVNAFFGTVREAVGRPTPRFAALTESAPTRSEDRSRVQGAF